MTTEVNVVYQLAVTNSYKFNICSIGNTLYDAAAYYDKESLPDVEVTRPNTETDLSIVHNKCLVTVNGYVYPTTMIDDRLYIANATKSMVKSKKNNVGILSFENFGTTLKKTVVTDSMVTADTNQSLYQKAIITFSDEIISPILAVGGYMIFEDPETFFRISNNSFVLKLEKLNFIEKLYELNRTRDIFDELNVPTSINNSTMIDGAVAKSDITIRKFLTLFNSFMVDVGTTNLHTRKIYLEHSNVPGNFRTEKLPNKPILVGQGKVGEYVVRQRNTTKYNVYVADAYYNQSLINNTAFQSAEKIYNDHRLVGSTYRLSQAFFLDIYAIK